MRVDCISLSPSLLASTMLLYLPSIFGQAGLSRSLDPAQTALKELFDWVSIVIPPAYEEC